VRAISELAERAWFHLSLMLGRLLRAGRYSEARILEELGEECVRKHRSIYAPVLVWLGNPLMSVLGTGVRVLPQREWEERERQIYGILYGTSVRIEVGALVMPRLPGETLATLLEDPRLGDEVRNGAVAAAVVALAALHRLGFTHGDAMAENVLVDLGAGVARWIDFETVHDPDRDMAWRRADDLRALLATCLLRTIQQERAETLRVIVDAYGDPEVARVLVRSFASAWRRPLPFHLGQAGLSYRAFREIGRLMREMD
jgi:hypothetical protein